MKLESQTVEKECFISQYYCEQKVYLSHMWHSAEMFLYLQGK